MTIGNMRVTQKAIADQTMLGLQGNMDRLATTQERLSTGKMLNRPSDSPTGMVSSLQLRSDVMRYKQWERNADDGLAFLGTIDTALTGSLSSVRRVRDLTVQGLNGGAMGPQQRQAIANEILTLRDQLIAESNTTFKGRPVFGGISAGRAAYDSTGAFVGDASAPVLRTVGPSSQVRVDTTGPEIYGVDGVGTTSLFTRLTQLATDMVSNPAGLTADLNALDGHLDKMISALSDVGARYKHIESMRELATSRQVDLGQQLSEVEDVDMAKTIMDLQLQQTAYQAALGATAKVVQPSLLDFLR